MAIVRALVESRSSPENPSTNLANPAAWFTEMVTGGKTPSGVAVNNSNAMGLTAVYASIRVIAETVASLPLPTYRRLQPRGKERATDHPLYLKLHDRPNPEMSAFTFWETFASHVVGWGNGYAEIQMDGAGRPVWLWPLLPDRTEAIRDNDGRKVYRTRVGGEWVYLAPDRVLHVPGMGFDGLRGYNPITLHRNALGLSLAAQEYGERYFGNGSRASGVLKHPGKLSPDAHKRLKESWSEMHQGLSNAHRAAILEEGMDWQQTSIPPEEAQFLETRKFQVEEIARIFRVQPHLIGDLTRSTNNNIEHQSLEFVIHTIRPWLVRFEKAINHDLFSERERGQYFAEFLIDGLLRGDAASRATALAVQRQNGIINADEWREIENMNPQPDGQGSLYLVPLNMVPADMARKLAEKQAEPTPAPVAPAPAEEDERAREARAVVDLAEYRVKRSIDGRRRQRSVYEGVFRTAADSLVKSEVNAARRALRKAFGGRDSALFREWVDEYYEKRGEDWIRGMAPYFRAFAEVVQAEAAEEVGAPVGMTPELNQFSDEYIAAFAARQVGSSAGQLREILRDVPPEEVEAAIEQRLGEWEEKRSDKIARRESSRALNAFAEEAYYRAGVRTLKWRTGGPDCPLCNTLEGRTVAIRQPFLGEGVTIDPADGTTPPLVTKHFIRHPPLHDGCDCLITAA